MYELVEDRILEVAPNCNTLKVNYTNDIFYEAIKFKPDAILSYTIGDIHSSEMDVILKYLFGCRFFILSHEGIFDTEDSQAIKPMLCNSAKYDPNLVDLFITWGEAQCDKAKRLLIDRNLIKSEKQVDYAGFPFLEEYFTKDAQNIDNGLNEKRAQYEKTILFACSFDNEMMDFELTVSYPKGDAFLGEGTYEEECEEIYKEYIVKRKHSLDIEDNIVELAAKFPNVLFVIKHHPTLMQKMEFFKERFYQFDKFNNRDNIYVLSKHYRFIDIAAGCDLVVHFGGSIGFESYLLKKPAYHLYFKEGDDFKYYRNEFPHHYDPKIYADTMVDVLSKAIPSNIEFFPRKEKEEVLKKILNIDLDEIEKGAKYEPSKKVANIVLNHPKFGDIDETSVTLRNALSDDTVFYDRFLSQLCRVLIEDLFDNAGKVEYLSSIFEKILIVREDQTVRKLLDKIKLQDDPKKNAALLYIYILSRDLYNVVLDNKDIIIFGASTAGKALYGLIKCAGAKDQVKLFLDNDTNKYDETIEGIIIKSPSAISRDLSGHIIITSFADEVKEQLVNYGIMESSLVVVRNEIYKLSRFLS